MKVSLRWLREYVPLVHPPEVLAHQLTMAGTEVGGLHRIGGEWAGIVVGVVVGLEPHPQADRLHLATVDIGPERVRLVSGAPNLAPGQKAAYAPPGSRLRDGETGAPTSVSARTIRGIPSAGTICSGKELGLSEDHRGILILPPDAPVGAPLADVLGDTILDLEVTPNRPDCLGLLGVAREVAALTGQALREPPLEYPEVDPPVATRAAVEIRDPDLCPRYCAAVITGVRIGPSPPWLQGRLVAAGVRPINNIVDVTNYVMLETGQPLHAFDLTRLGGRCIVVRRAASAERLTTLDGTSRELTPDMLVIADAAEPVAVAGVMGGQASEVTEATTALLLESANFLATSIRRTSRALRLRTEASLRFDKGLSAELALPALRRATRLIVELTGGQAARGVLDAYPGRRPRPSVLITPAEVERVLGLVLEAEAIRTTLERLGFRCQAEGAGLRVTAPAHRSDIAIPADVVEEVARLVGYDRIPTTPLRGAVPERLPQPMLALTERLRDLLVGCGLQEVITYSLVGDRLVERLGDEARCAAALHLANPMTTDQGRLRTTLRGSLLACAAEARRAEEGGLALFEIGRVYLPRPGDLPVEPERLGVLLWGPRAPRGWAAPQGSYDFYDLKGLLQEILGRLPAPGAIWEPVADAHLHPGRTARIRVGDVVLGSAGEVHPEVAARFELPEAVFLAELHCDRLAQVVPADGLRVAPLPRFPGVRRDLALVVRDEVPAEALAVAIRQAGAPLLARTDLFDLFRGAPMAPGQVSMAFALLFQAPDRTLTDDEVDAVQARIVEALAARFGARLRAG